MFPEGKDEKRFTFDQVFAPETTQEVGKREEWIIDRAFLKELRNVENTSSKYFWIMNTILGLQLYYYCVWTNRFRENVYDEWRDRGRCPLATRRSHSSNYRRYIQRNESSIHSHRVFVRGWNKKSN